MPGEQNVEIQGTTLEVAPTIAEIMAPLQNGADRAFLQNYGQAAVHMIEIVALATILLNLFGVICS